MNAIATRNSELMKKASRRRRPVITEGIERIMQWSSSPGQLPGAEIHLPALFVEVGEEQEEQQRDDARNDHHADGRCYS